MKARNQKLLDYFPFAVVIGYSISEWQKYYQEGIVIKWQTYLGLLLMIAIFISLISKHKAGVLLIALLNISGLTGLASVSPAIANSFIKINSISLPIADPIFLLFLIIHFICSGRNYVGILTKDYWRYFKTKHSGNGR
jgi:hypothetical protein